MHKLIYILLLILVSCGTQKNIQQTTIIDSTKNISFIRDSVFIHDSIIIKEKNDTVYYTKYLTKVKNNIIRDTAFVTYTRTQYKDKIVEKEVEYIPWYMKMLSGLGVIFIAYFIYKCLELYKKFKI